MVAGDHLDVDPGGAALGDRLFRFKARWIEEADKAEQLDARHDVVERDPYCIRWHLLRAKCEDALALVSSVRDGILPIADVFGQGHCEEGFGRALDEEDHRSVRSTAERRHEAVRGIEWNLVEPLPFRALQFRIDRRLHRQDRKSTRLNSSH